MARVDAEATTRRGGPCARPPTLGLENQGSIARPTSPVPIVGPKLAQKIFPMSISFFAPASALFFLTCPVKAQPARAPAAQSKTAVRFEFETRLDADDTPHSRVFLRANGRRMPVFASTAGFQTLPRNEWKERGVPRNALAACTSWWAGAGDNLYVVRRGARLVVFRQEMDEQAPPFPWKRWKSLNGAPSKR